MAEEGIPTEDSGVTPRPPETDLIAGGGTDQQSQPFTPADVAPDDRARGVNNPDGTRIANEDKAYIMAGTEAMIREETGQDQIEEHFEKDEPLVLTEDDKKIMAERGNEEAERAGDEYELESLADKTGHTVLELARIMHRDIESNMAYGKKMIEQQQEFGEKLSPNQEAFLAICELAEKIKVTVDSSSRFYQREVGENTVRITGPDDGEGFNWRDNWFRLAASFTSYGEDDSRVEERWVASPFKVAGQSVGPNAVPYYTNGFIEETKQKGKDGFEAVVTTRYRPMATEDVEALRSRTSQMQVEN